MRHQLYEGGAAALKGYSDPMIVLATLVDPDARRLRRLVEEFSETEQEAYGQIAQARFSLKGNEIYPDATGTLRLSFGEVSGYEEDGKTIPAFTTFAGLYQRANDHQNREPFELPPRWIDRHDKLNLATRFNFVTTAGKINSGHEIQHQFKW